MNRLGKIVIFIIISVFVMSIFLYVFFLKNNDKQTLSPGTMNILYDATAEIEKAKKKLKDSSQASTVIEDVNTMEKIVAVTFEGMVDQDTTNQLLQLLKNYNAKATFFVPGIKGAEDPETVRSITKSGHIIGNYTLSANMGMDKFPNEELVEDFAQTNVILRDITGELPTLLKCNVTNYTQQLLKASYSSGLESTVHSTHFLNYQSFSSQGDALGYVKNLEKGSIISIKIDSNLDVSEYKKSKKNKKETLAIDLGPGLNMNKGISTDSNKKLVEVVAYLLAALKEENYKIVLVNQLPTYEDSSYYVDGTIKEGGQNIAPLHMLVENLDTSIFSNNKISSQPNRGKTNQDPTITNDTQGLNIDMVPADYQKKRIKNAGKKSKLISHFNTTEPVVAYTFRGVTDKAILRDILGILEELDSRATFFVTGKEIINYPENINMIIDKGHAIANGGYGMASNTSRLLDFDSLSYEIDMGERCLRAFLGENYLESINKVYMSPYGDTRGDILEVASSLGYEKVIYYNRNAIRDGYEDLSADEIIAQYFSNTISLQRGDIIHFRLDYLMKQNAIQDLVRKIAENYIKNATYDIKDIVSLDTSSFGYEPRLRKDAVGADFIKESYGYPKEFLDSLIIRKYIGNPDISSSNELVGFDADEILKVNTKGKIETNDKKVIFLSFDDWGSDASITPLLNVLKKYNVKSTFFVRVGRDNIGYDSDFINPNLLRAIALDGHDIGSHTFKHMKVNIDTIEEQTMLAQDLIAAHQEMARYIGDTGALKPFFRPPTLAISKLGLETIFDSGYEYIINGDFSSHDYEATSAQQLIDKLKNGINISSSGQEVNESTPSEDIRRIESGSIVVMHMSDESMYTPEALDTIIPYYMDQGYSFAKLSDYLKDDYQNK